MYLNIKVVFFGDNVPKERADKAMEVARECDAFLVLGSSLMTMSAFRLVRYIIWLISGVRQKYLVHYSIYQVYNLVDRWCSPEIFVHYSIYLNMIYLIISYGCHVLPYYFKVCLQQAVLKFVTFSFRILM